MKNTLILLIFLALFATSINSQSNWKISFKTGPAFSKSKYDPRNGTEKYGLGLSSGFDFYRFKKEHLFFKTGINYNLKVTNYSVVLNIDTTFESKSKGSHVTIPLMLGYRINIDQHNFFVAAGLEIDYLFDMVQTSNLYGTARWYSHSLEHLAPKYVLSIAYLNKINEHYSLMFNPEYSSNLGIRDILDNGDKIASWRFNFGIIYKY